MALDPRPGERVYQEIKQAILSGELVILQRLDIDKLASQFGVSATPVRYALAILAAERLVRLNTSRIYQVAFWSERELRELYQWRQHLTKWALQSYAPEALSALASDADYAGAYLAMMGHIDRNANTEARRAGRSADERLQQALRAETDALPGAHEELNQIAASLDRGGAVLANKLRRYFERRISHCAAIARLKPPVRPHSNVMGALAPAGEDAEAPPDHAWLSKLRWEAPARVLRIHQLLQALSYFDEGALPGGGGTHPLLLSQPIVETCLRIPPYVMTAGGKERALARAAFADLVPPDVARRVTKGETTRYFAAVLAANESWIRDVLCGGRLVQDGVVDADALERALACGWLQDGMAADGLYALIAAECWLRNLEAARERAMSALAASSAVSQSAPPL
jgi:hypothetical protein